MGATPAGSTSDGSVPKLNREGETCSHISKDTAQVTHTTQEPREPLDLPRHLPNHVPMEVDVDGATQAPSRVADALEARRGHILALVPVEAEGAPGPEVGAAKAAKVVTATLGAACVVTAILEGIYPC